MYIMQDVRRSVGGGGERASFHLYRGWVVVVVVLVDEQVPTYMGLGWWSRLMSECSFIWGW